MASETVEIPFVVVGNSRALTAHQVRDDKYLADFVERFRRCFEYDEKRALFIFNEE